MYSCGIYADTGDFATEEAVRAVQKYGVDITSHRATNVREANVEKMDFVFCATYRHKQMILTLYPSMEGKVYTIKEYANAGKEEGIDIADPWGCSYEVYTRCAEEIKENLEKIYEQMEEKGLTK